MPNRFWQKVDIGLENDCWHWQGCKNEKGYGVAGHQGKTKKAHRLAYELLVGTIPDGMCLLHTCDNPSCCNPAHLRVGTRADNNADMREKGRARYGSSKTPRLGCAYKRGERHPQSKFDAETVRAIRADREVRGMSLSAIAKKHQCGITTVYKIVHRVTWFHIE
jgi:hypothetical protein